MSQAVSVGAYRQGPSASHARAARRAPFRGQGRGHFRGRGRRGWSAIELLVVIAVVALLVGILLPALGAARRTAHKAASGSNLRSIGQSLAIAANANKEWYAGLDSRGLVGSVAKGHGYDRFGNHGEAFRDRRADDRFAVAGGVGSGDNPAVRLAVLLQAQILTPEILINPAESARKAEAWEGEPISSEHYSYAMLALGGANTDRDTAYTPPIKPVGEEDYGRPATRGAQEWKGTINTQAVLMSDRNTGDDNVGDWQGGPSVGSVWSRPGDGEWQGHVLYGDCGIEFLNTQYMERTRYGNALALDAHDMDSGSDGQTGDNLFYVNDKNNDGETGHNADAVMIYPIAGDTSGDPVLGTTRRNPNPGLAAAE
ncbi:MAG: hypothetical protein AAGA57_09255 [Planctomycetota bacterium]